MPRRFFLLLLSLVLVACTPLTPLNIISTEITGEEIWRGRIAIDGDVIIAENAVVRVAPGTEIIFLSPSPGQDRLTDHPNFVGSELVVRGRLLAEGTAQAPITFRALDPLAPAGSWGAINLARSVGSRFRYCHFTQADSAIHSQEAQVEISCSTFTRNLVGVRFFGSQIKITDNLFSENGTAIRFHFGAPTIRGNLLQGNDKGLFITSFPKDYQITANTIVGSREAQVVLGEEVPDDLYLPGNYWGSVDRQEIASHFFDGQQSDYLGKIRFEPFLYEPPPTPESVCNP